MRELLAAADRQQQEARNSYRALAADLRAAGLSVSDTAAILGVSRGRVSQLSKASIEDAFALAGLLAEARPDDLEATFSRYQALRRARTRKIQRRLPGFL